MSQRDATEPRPHLRLDPTTRRAQLLEAAAAVFQGRDPNGVSIDEVAEAGGVSRSLVYTYFGDRSGLIASVYVHHLQRLDRELDWSVADGLPDHAQLSELIRHHLVFARDNGAAWTALTAGGGLPHPDIQAARRDRVATLASGWGETPAARLVASAVVGLVEAGAQDWAEHRDIDIDAATDVLAAILWEGLTGLRARGSVPAGSGS